MWGHLSTDPPRLRGKAPASITGTKTPSLVIFCKLQSHNLKESKMFHQLSIEDVVLMQWQESWQEPVWNQQIPQICHWFLLNWSHTHRGLFKLNAKCWSRISDYTRKFWKHTKDVEKGWQTPEYPYLSGTGLCCCLLLYQKSGFVCRYLGRQSDTQTRTHWQQMGTHMIHITILCSPNGAEKITWIQKKMIIK